MIDGGAAFPVSEDVETVDGKYVCETQERGMSLRDYFAAHAPRHLELSVGAQVDAAYDYADAMIERRNR